MSADEVITLPHGTVTVGVREGYLYLIESGTLANAAEVAIYTREVDRIIARTSITRAVIDARDEVGEPPDEVRDAMWRWLLDPNRGFDQVAFVLPSEIAVARANMTALARGSKIRAFDTVLAAHRWVSRERRQTISDELKAVKISSRPPQTAGSYHVTDSQTERVNLGGTGSRPPREPSGGDG